MTADPPYSMLAELTHRCPLHCAYCSNPVELMQAEQELETERWLQVLDQAAALGVVQVGFSGGEPLVRDDLEDLVGRAHQLGLYSNLITSGLGLTEERAQKLAWKGLNSIQLSIQAADAGLGDRIAGRKAHHLKAAAAQAIKDAGLPLSMNVVLHRFNLDRIGDMIDLCANWGAQRVELANTQYYGWALVNRSQLMPSRQQVEHAERVFTAKKRKLAGRVELIWVPPDYHDGLPKPCMGGWGRISLTVAPDGEVMPCPVASSISGMRFQSVRDGNLESIWQESPAFNAFRGYEWMREPCRGCPRREVDFGGCRCQAFALTGDATRTDPVCRFSPDHHLVAAALEASGELRAVDRLTYRHLR